LVPVPTGDHTAADADVAATPRATIARSVVRERFIGTSEGWVSGP
jgi:hypothetical protein